VQKEDAEPRVRAACGVLQGGFKDIGCGEKNICGYVLLSIPQYNFVSVKAGKKTVLKVSTALKMLFGSLKILSLGIKTFTLI